MRNKNILKRSLPLDKTEVRITGHKSQPYLMRNLERKRRG
jgi:hypothetical protein